MTSSLTPIRRVVTGNDERGRSKVVWDGPAPNAHEASLGSGSGRGHTDLWVWNEAPAPLAGTTDDGNLGYTFPGPDDGGHFRVVHAPARAANYDPTKDKDLVAPHPPKLRAGLTRTWDRGGNSAFSSAMHKTETIDYGIMLSGEREVVLDDVTLLMKPGDIDLGALKAQGIVPREAKAAKVIVSGKLTRSVTLKGVLASKGARAAIEAAGGKVEDAAPAVQPAGA